MDTAVVFTEDLSSFKQALKRRQEEEEHRVIYNKSLKTKKDPLTVTQQAQVSVTHFPIPALRFIIIQYVLARLQVKSAFRLFFEIQVSQKQKNDVFDLQ